MLVALLATIIIVVRNLPNDLSLGELITCDHKNINRQYYKIILLLQCIFYILSFTRE